MTWVARVRALAVHSARLKPWWQKSAQLETVCDRSGETVPPNGSAQGTLEVARAIAKLG